MALQTNPSHAGIECCTHPNSEQGETTGLLQLGICFIWNVKCKQPLTKQTKMSNKGTETYAFSLFLTSHYSGECAARRPHSWAEMLTSTTPAQMMLPQQPEPSKASRATGTEWQEHSHMAH